MSERLPPLPDPKDWRRTNPGYQYSPPEVIDGVLWVDGGVWSDVVTAAPGQPKGKK